MKVVILSNYTVKDTIVDTNDIEAALEKYKEQCLSHATPYDLRENRRLCETASAYDISELGEGEDIDEFLDGKDPDGMINLF